MFVAEKFKELNFIISFEDACKAYENDSCNDYIRELSNELPDHLQLDKKVANEQMYGLPLWCNGSLVGICLQHEIFEEEDGSYHCSGKHVDILREDPEKGIDELKKFIDFRINYC